MVECNICFEIILKKDIYNKECCSSIFCKNCVKKWKQFTTKCPICKVELKQVKKKLTTNEIINLFETMFSKKPNESIDDMVEFHQTDNIFNPLFDIPPPPPPPTPRNRDRRTNFINPAFINN